MEVFNWESLVGSSVSYDEKINEVQFGDGYEQTSPDGLNSIRRKFSNLRFISLDKGRAQEIKDFYLRHGRAKAFQLKTSRYDAIVRFDSPLQCSKKGDYEEVAISMKEVFR